MSASAKGPGPMTLDQVRDRLSGRRGPEFWRSLEELADTPQRREILERERIDDVFNLARDDRCIVHRLDRDRPGRHQP
mgnify:CR=1 FL=1